MYNDHFRFSEAPFSIAPDPRYLYLSGQHKEAIAHLKYGVEANGGFILLTGEVGTGKTTACRCFLERLPDDIRVAMLLNPPLNETELLQAICDELHIGYAADENVNKLTMKLNDFLLRAHGEGLRTVVIVEEAQHLDRAILERLRLLTNLETDRHKLLQVILIGQPELLENIESPDMRQLAQRVIARHHLRALTRKELDAYMEHRLKVVGGSIRLFPKPVRTLLHRLSKGVPRVVNLLCDRALLGCYVQGNTVVSARVLRRAASEVLGGKSARKGKRAKRGKRAGGTAFVKLEKLAWGTAAAATMVGAAYLASAWVMSPDHMEGVAVSVSDETNETVESGEPIGRPIADAPLSAQSGAWDAYQAVFKRWGLAEMPEGMTPCEYAESHRLDCWRTDASLTELLRLNRPAVVKLRNAIGVTRYVALLSSSDGHATVRNAYGEERVSLGDLRNDWAGEYTVLWRRPPGYVDTIRPGYRGEVLPWLSARLASVKGRVPRTLDVYDPVTMDAVRQIQRECGLSVDGLAGRRTVIMLNSLTGEAPLLSPPNRVCDGKLS